MTFLWFHDNPTPHNHSVLYSRCYNPFPFQRPPAPVADTSARLSPLAAQVQLLQQSLFLSSEHLVSQRTQCENLPVKLSFSSFCPASIWSRSARSENFPSRALTFLFRPASIWSHSGRSARKSPGQAVIFLFLSSKH